MMKFHYLIHFLLQEKYLPSDDRRLAETHYQLGVAFSFSDEFDKSIDSFGSAAKVIDVRLKNLKNKVSDMMAMSDEDRLKSKLF